MAVAAMFLSADGVRAQDGGPEKSRKILVVYYSYSGNTRTAAQEIARRTGGELFEIEPQTPYPTDYRAVADQAKKEIADGVRPALKRLPEDLSQYDAVFVGSPCWWATVAPPVASLLAACDLRGKRVLPFMTHEGSGMGRSEADIRALCPASTVEKGLALRGRAVGSSQAQIAAWLRRMALAE